MKVTFQNLPVTLDKGDYLGQGGEGTVYVKNGVAFKIYHDPNKCIPEAKIQELSLVSDKHVLTPLGAVFSRGKMIGFGMPFVSGLDYLSRAFNIGFRQSNNINEQAAKSLVEFMRERLARIHAAGVLVVDYNEFNFLLDMGARAVYHIDTDSYQTPSFRATAIMESIRDRRVSKNAFSTGSDWFSFAVVAFQLYTCTHPYKCVHPDFKRKDWSLMMDQGVSVFDSKAKFPPNTLGFGPIPPSHLGWFKDIFVGGERKAPPKADEVKVNKPITPTLIPSNESFEISIFHDLQNSVMWMGQEGGQTVALTADGMFIGGRRARNVEILSKGDRAEILCLKGGIFERVVHKKLRGKIFVGDETFDTNGYFREGNSIYSLSYDNLIQITFDALGPKIFSIKRSLGQAAKKTTVFDGVFVQDLLGTSWIGYPMNGGFHNIKITELSGHRVFDGRRSGEFAQFASEKNGKFYKTYIVLGDAPHIIQEEKVDFPVVNFCVVKGFCVSAEGGDLCLYHDLLKVKKVANFPLTNGERLISLGSNVAFCRDTKIYQLKLK